jgi:hypothetical protein
MREKKSGQIHARILEIIPKRTVKIIRSEFGDNRRWR